MIYGCRQLTPLQDRTETSEASLPAGVGWVWNRAWPAGGRLPKAEELGLLPKTSKLAKPPWEGVWPIDGGNVKVI
jgi:hypothetical protein